MILTHGSNSVGSGGGLPTGYMKLSYIENPNESYAVIADFDIQCDNIQMIVNISNVDNDFNKGNAYLFAAFNQYSRNNGFIVNCGDGTYTPGFFANTAWFTAENETSQNFNFNFVSKKEQARDKYRRSKYFRCKHGYKRLADFPKIFS